MSDAQLHWLGSSFSTFSLLRILGSLILKHTLQLVKEHQQVCGQDGIQDLLAKNWFTRFTKVLSLLCWKKDKIYQMYLKEMEKRYHAKNKPWVHSVPKYVKFGFYRCYHTKGIVILLA